MKLSPTHAVASRTIASPLGSLILLASERGLSGLFFAHRFGSPEGLPDDSDNRHLAVAEAQLAEYFAGERTKFTVPLDLRGTEFQQCVWAELQEIPFGTTRSYGEIARRIGKPKSTRPVGLANGSNPVSVIIPCHRVIGADGSLTGFGGGLETKRRLLVMEGAFLDAA